MQRAWRGLNFLINPLMRRVALIGAIVAAAGALATAAEPCALKSPDGHLEAVVSIDAAGQLRFALNRDGQAIVKPSPLGITVDGAELGRGATLGRAERQAIHEIYPVTGGHASATNDCNALTLPLTHMASRAAYSLELRIFNDGAAYRYCVPGAGERRVTGEASSWELPAGSDVWTSERPNAWKLKSYAGYWIKTPLAGLEKATKDPVQGPPLVIVLPGGQGYAVLTEAALDNYSGLRLRALGGGRLAADFTEGPAGFAVAGEVVTPWRVTMVSRDLDGLVRSDILTNLNPPPDPALFTDRSWIKPGRAVWSWMAEAPKSPENFEIQKHYVDLAAGLGFEYTLVDEGWPKLADPWGKLAELSALGRAKGVGVLIWVRYEEIARPDEHYRVLREYLDKVRAAGVAGLKIDFINGESKAAIDFEMAALTEAARRHLLVVFHGCQKPTGEPRRFPNELSREAVRGMELNFMKEGPLTPRHDAALPFTRYLAGHGDYTPVILRPERMGQTTWAHQIAMAVALTSPLLVFAEKPELMSVNPGFDVMKSIPATWDETRALAGSAIGELALLARRKGEAWFVAAVGGEGAQKVKLPLSFASGQAYRAIILTDKPERPDALARQERTVHPGDTLELSLSAGGGAVIRLEPAGEKQVGRP